MVRPNKPVIDQFGHTETSEDCDCGHDFDDEFINWHFGSCPAWEAAEARRKKNFREAIDRGDIYIIDPVTDEDRVATWEDFNGE